MPISRKSTKPEVTPQAVPTPRPLADWVRDRLPSRIVVFVIVRDESGSMRHWRQRQGEFIPAVKAHLLEVGGAKAGNLILLLYCVVSGGVVTTEFVPLGYAKDPEFNPDGQTPIGSALGLVADKVTEFFETRVFPEEVTVRNTEFLIISDLKATGESSEETNSGVEKFIAMAAKFRAKVTLVGPSPEEMDEHLPRKLDISERGVKFLDADPNSILDITLDSLVAASRLSLGGSNPTIRIR